jgi:hypothetical protein
MEKFVPLFRIYIIQLIKSGVRKNDVILQNAGESCYSCQPKPIIKKKIKIFFHGGMNPTVSHLRGEI